MAPISLAVIPAAGRGRRWHPMSRYIPKEMLPVGTLPLIHHHLRILHQVGVQEVIVVIHEDKPLLAEYLGTRSTGMPIVHVIYQTQRNGVIPALSQALKPHQPRRPVLVLYPDNFFPEGPQGILEFIETAVEQDKTLLAFVRLTEALFRASGASASWDLQEGPSPLLYPRSLGAKGREWRPSSPWRAVGLWALHPEDLPLLHQMARPAPGARQEIDDVDFFRQLLGQQRLMGYAFPYPVIDAGNPRGYILAWKAFLEKNP